MAEEEKIEKQEPVKPSKKKGSMSVPMMIGIGAGAVIILFVVAFFGMQYMVGNIIDKKLANVVTDSTAHSGNHDEHKDEEHHEEDDHGKSKEAKNNEAEAEWEKYEAQDILSDIDPEIYQTGRIITNPKIESAGSKPRYLVIDLAIYYVTSLGEHAEEKGGDDGHGGGGDGDHVDPKVKKIEPRIKGKISSYIGRYNEAELSSMRPYLADSLLAEMKPLFMKNKVYLKDVEVTEFIIQ